MFFNNCNSCGCCNPNIQMPQFEIVSPCCFRPRGGVFLIRQRSRTGNRSRNDRDDRWDDRDRNDCGCQRGNR